MDNQNRYEEVPQKESKAKVFFKTLGKYFKEVWLNFLEGFKYNNMKLPAILVAIPGVFIGFFLGFHAECVHSISFVNSSEQGYWLFEQDLSPLFLFILMLAGILNIFSSLGLSGKKNLGSVIKCLIGTVLIVIAGIFYLVFVFIYMNGINSGILSSKDGFSFGAVWWVSIISIIISMLTSVAGVVLGFIRYDRTYEKVDR